MEDDNAKVEMINVDSKNEEKLFDETEGLKSVIRRKSSARKDSNLSNDNEEVVSIVSDIDLENVDNPRKRELLLMAKIHTMKEKLVKRDKLIEQLKEMMENDDALKLALQEKVNELRKKIEKFKEDMQKNDEAGNNEEELLKLESEGNKLDAMFVEEGHDNKKNDFFMIGNNMKTNVKTNNFVMSNQIMNNYETRVYQQEVQQSSWARFMKGLDYLFDILMPLREDLIFVSSHYDKNIEGFFEFSRFLLIFTIFIFFTYLYLLIIHIINFDFNQIYGNWCNYFLPCFVFYSRFSKNEKLAFSYSFAFVCFVIFFGTVKKFLEFNKKNVFQKLYEGEDLNYSKMFLNIWDWNVRNQTSLDDSKSRVRNIITIGIREEEIKEIVKERTSDERCNLLTRRIFSISMSILLLFVSAAGIAGAYILRGYVASQFTNISNIMKFAIDLIPAVLIAVINMIVPFFLQLFVTFEKWDYNSTAVSQMMWRLYIARLFNIIVVYFLNITLFVFDISSSTMFSYNLDFGMKFSCPNTNSVMLSSIPTSGASLIANTSYCNCREDQAIINFFLNLIVDFIIRKIIDVALYFVALCKKKPEDGENFKPPYDVADSAPDALIFVVQIYFLIPFFPYITVIAPILLYLDFKFELIKLRYLKSKALKSSLRDETAYFIMSLFNATMYIILAVFIVYFDFEVPHENWTICYDLGNGNGGYFNLTTPNCGAYESTERPADAMIDNIKSTGITNFLWNIISSPVFLLCGFVIFIIFIFFSDDSDSFINYIKQKESENKNTISGMNEQISKLRNQVKILRVNKLREE